MWKEVGIETSHGARYRYRPGCSNSLIISKYQQQSHCSKGAIINNNINNKVHAVQSLSSSCWLVGWLVDTDFATLTTIATAAIFMAAVHGKPDSSL